MICLVLALNLDLKMSSKLTSICDCDHSDSPPFIEPPYINCWKKGVPCVESATSRSTRCQFCNLGKIKCSQANHNFPENPRRLWRSIKKGRRFGLEAPVDEPPTSDATSGNSNWGLNDQRFSELLTSVIFFSSSSLTGSRMRGVQQLTNSRSSWANTGGPIHPQGNPIGVAPEVPILVIREDGRL
ncbi:hypothetical protein O181_100308 [Austropuccinia psidii MF-1]|uniref:Zn(2)-C6 fungal-type domain-containing protein n=1 Tax=Austropuccinia psidii MF-1 TaxID=1389203 RepID=A0A9Q3JEF5_9BASI|nr:hypothetical protein [Austropuccinia psidii MF-1]